MINLLPGYFREKLEQEELLKATVILGVVFVMIFTSFTLMLLLVKIFYSVELNSAEVLLAEKAEEIKIYDVESYEEMIIASNDSILKINDFHKNQIKITDLFSKTAEIMPSGVFLFRMDYYDGKVALYGYAPSRDSLLAFKNNMENNQYFKNVIFPSENWLTAQDIDFSVNFGI